MVPSLCGNDEDEDEKEDLPLVKATAPPSHAQLHQRKRCVARYTVCNDEMATAMALILALAAAASETVGIAALGVVNHASTSASVQALEHTHPHPSMQYPISHPS